MAENAIYCPMINEMISLILKISYQNELLRTCIHMHTSHLCEWDTSPDAPFKLGPEKWYVERSLWKVFH